MGQLGIDFFNQLIIVKGFHEMIGLVCEMCSWCMKLV